MKINIHLDINAPLDLVWELLAEGTTTEHCPVTGIISHDIIEEYEDGILQNVTFNDRPMLKRVFVDDDNHQLLIEYKNKAVKEGEIRNSIAPKDPEATRMNFSIQWFSEDATTSHHKEIEQTYQERLNDFKAYAEGIWGQSLEVKQKETVH